MTEPGSHLSQHEAAQLLLHPTADAIDAYVESSEHAKARLVEIAIDVIEMVVEVAWVGGVLDPGTEAAFAAITAETGIEIKIIPRRFSRDDLFAAADEIFRTQDGVQVTSSRGDVIAVTVGYVWSLAGRPAEVSPPGKDFAIPVTYERGQIELLATGQSEPRPVTPT
ncbi:hypothetical protein [Microlunatus speluncae]|uniref:hypothetical protein n=1 Tax=Microlunatus speluncae TaxID=2594267 RepID=UPI0012666A83|nr:hypothetical protein [Microlunatus speluncae]